MVRALLSICRSHRRTSSPRAKWCIESFVDPNPCGWSNLAGCEPRELEEAWRLFDGMGHIYNEKKWDQTFFNIDIPPVRTKMWETESNYYYWQEEGKKAPLQPPVQQVNQKQMRVVIMKTSRCLPITLHNIIRRNPWVNGVCILTNDNGGNE